MAKFIEVTDVKGGGKVLINADLVLFAVPDDSGTKIRLAP